MSNDIDNYVKNVNELVSIREKINKGEISTENYNKDDIDLFITTYKSSLDEATDQANKYLEMDFSNLTIETLKDLKKIFEPWKNRGFKDKKKPSEVVDKVNEELKKRLNKL